MVFYLNYFSCSKFSLICFLNFFFLKCFNSFFAVKITNNISLRQIIFNFFNHKIFLRPIWKVTFSKNFFVFQCSYMVPTLNLYSFSFIFYTKVTMCGRLYINRFHFDCALICVILLIHCII